MKIIYENNKMKKSQDNDVLNKQIKQMVCSTPMNPKNKSMRFDMDFGSPLSTNKKTNKTESNTGKDEESSGYSNPFFYLENPEQPKMMVCDSSDDEERVFTKPTNKKNENTSNIKNKENEEMVQVNRKEQNSNVKKNQKVKITEKIKSNNVLEEINVQNAHKDNFKQKGIKEKGEETKDNVKNNKISETKNKKLKHSKSESINKKEAIIKESNIALENRTSRTVKKPVPLNRSFKISDEIQKGTSAKPEPNKENSAKKILSKSKIPLKHQDNNHLKTDLFGAKESDKHFDVLKAINIKNDEIETNSKEKRADDLSGKKLSTIKNTLSINKKNKEDNNKEVHQNMTSNCNLQILTPQSMNIAEEKTNVLNNMKKDDVLVKPIDTKNRSRSIINCEPIRKSLRKSKAIKMDIGVNTTPGLKNIINKSKNSNKKVEFISADNEASASNEQNKEKNENTQIQNNSRLMQLRKRKANSSSILNPDELKVSKISRTSETLKSNNDGVRTRSSLTRKSNEFKKKPQTSQKTIETANSEDDNSEDDDSEDDNLEDNNSNNDEQSAESSTSTTESSIVTNSKAMPSFKKKNMFSLQKKKNFNKYFRHGKNGNVNKQVKRNESIETFSKRALRSRVRIGINGFADVRINEKHDFVQCFGQFPDLTSDQKRSNDFKISISNDMITSGVIKILPNGIKNVESPKRVNLYFFILDGMAEVGIGHSSKVLRIGDSFFVPEGVDYYIINVSSTDDLLLNFCKYYKKT